MLTLQRASAGSGKTYTLTKRYIGLLISIQDPGHTERRLRTKPELADSVQHILAVTFTNKATNEMKERIVGKLYELAYPPAGGKSPDYMEDFMREYAASAEEVSEACREALHQVLYEYSDFNISTIDAFFQNILRTFAYESDLPDSYQVVIDQTYLARLAALGLVADISQGTADPDDRYWVDRLIDNSNLRGESNWNLFQRRDGGKRSGSGVFGRIISMAANLERSDMKEIREAMDTFAETGQNLRESREKIEELIAANAALLFAPMAAAASKMLKAYSAHGDPATTMPRPATTLKFIEQVLDPAADPLGDYKLTESAGHLSSKLKVARKREMEYLRPFWEQLMAAYREWKDYTAGDDVRYWRMLENSLPEVALTATLRGRINDYLMENDAMKLADTNSMIRRIIADDDVPFIYERLGTRLNHFLIDEFQDTSLMQWENFRPLLEESESHGHANLIIGDAKQSIYRFRSAEPTLITDIVPATFPGLEQRGFSVEENSNWRSRSNIVKFNNFFFRALSHRLSDRIASLYSNTVQLPRSKDDEAGYVEMNFYDISQMAATLAADDAESADTSGQSTGKVPMPIVERIGALITSLLRRGYRQKEIAVIVNTREAGKDVIAGLMNYNRTLPDTDEVLEFVSEDSLTLDTSAAVNTVIECFRLIQENVEGKRNSPEESEVKGRANWVDIQNNFRFFSARHPGMELSERLRLFFEEGLNDSLIDEMIAGMQAITLPSLVEALTEIFTTPAQRRAEAPFLAAFQDAVLDYCEANPTDIGSMLRWWDGGGHNISISSPEDTDAINVLTIHKSKGLEFECVILPDIDINLDIKDETLWLPVPPTLTYARLLPTLLPVAIGRKKAEDTIWSDLFEKERYQVQVDQINKAYVAMTRTVSEMYIFMQAPFRNASEVASGAEDPDAEYPELESKESATIKMRHHAYEICRDADEYISEGAEDDASVSSEREGEVAQAGMFPAEGEIIRHDGVWGFSYGRRVADVAQALSKSRGKKSRSVESRTIGHYFVNSDREILKFQPENTPYIQDIADDDRADPRSEGSLKHAVLELVEKEDDLHHALARLRGRGVITRRVMRRYEEELGEALEQVRDRGWFDGSWRVLNERPVLQRGRIMKRPDRVMVGKDGDAIVIDYKFGDTAKVSEHRRQVGEYMGLLEAMGRFRSVKGYIWYVRLGEILEVTSSISPDQADARKKV